VDVGVYVGVAVNVLVRVGVYVSVKDGVNVGVALWVGVKVDVDVGVKVKVGVFVGDEVAVLVLVGVNVNVDVKVEVEVLLGVKVGVLVLVGVKVNVEVGVNVDVGVLVGVKVCVAVGEAVWVDVGVRVEVDTVKLVELVDVPPGLITLIGPVVAPAGTVASIEVAEITEKLAMLPLNRTKLAWEKLYPVIVTLVPAGPPVGKNPVMAGGTALTAAAASSMPLPHKEVVQVLPDGNGLTVACRICSTWAGVKFGLSENISETTPVTCGVAMLVPW
jgi:hypothetical protein